VGVVSLLYDYLLTFAKEVSLESVTKCMILVIV
jgi:hypothetical protein